MITAADAAMIEAMAVMMRGVVLIIVAFGGCLSIYLGWKLYRDGMLSNVEGEASSPNGWRFRLTAAGPGVFFALFGMWLLIHLVDQPLDTEQSTEMVPVEEQGSPPAAVNSSAAAQPASVYRAALQANPIQKPRVCLVARRRIRMLDGDLSPQGVRRSLNMAIVVLESRRPTVTGTAAAQLSDAIDTLRQMEESTGEWEMRR